MAQPATPLSPLLLVRKEDVPESVKPPSPERNGGKMMVSYRPSSDFYYRLRALSFSQDRKMQVLLDEAVDDLFAKYKV